MSPWLLAMISGKRRVITETFTSSQTWVCPLGVSRLNTLVGKGQDGTADSSIAKVVAAVSVQYFTVGTGDGPVANDWSNAQNGTNSALSSINAGGTVTYNQIIIRNYSGTSETLSGGSILLNQVIASTATASYTAGWQSSGVIASSADSSINYSELVPAAAGANTTGFGYTFAGGAPDTPAVPVQHLNVAVTGGASYALVVPTGGSIVITYYR